MCGGKVRIQLDGALVFALGACPLPGLSFAKRQRVVRIGEALIQVHRFARRTFGFGRKLFWVENAPGHKIKVADRQLGISERVSRIGVYRLIVILGGFLRVLRSALATIVEPFEHQFIGLWVNRLALGELLLVTGTQAQANWVSVTGNNTVLPNRPVLGIALDPSVPAVDVPVGYAAIGGFNANTPTTLGHIFQVTCAANCGSFTWADKTGDLPDIPVDSIIVNPNNPLQVYAGTDWGVYFTDDVTVASPTWQRFENGIPHAMVWDMQIDRGSTTLSVWTRSRDLRCSVAKVTVSLSLNLSAPRRASQTDRGNADWARCGSVSNRRPTPR